MSLSVVVFGSVACEKKKQEPLDLQNLPPQQLVEVGKNYYVSNCTSCHALDPRQDHPVGPAVWGSSLPLLEARILHGNYPEGYSPKRSTRMMAAMPFLKEKIPAIYAFLNAQ